ncbi:methyltransferase domain-containing protein [Kribbella sp. NPDC023972]|uniref:methyltransferase domain-containing protein n=1 Tax=Kribbella sp. NPDC023972 TaxID=3154795 RepID=UPI0033E39813
MHRALQAHGWTSKFLVEHPQRMLEDYEFEQVVIPSYQGCLRGDGWWGGDGSSNLCTAVVDAVFEEAPDLVVHDVVVHDAVYAAAARCGIRQVLIARPRADVSDVGAWVVRHAPAVDTVFQLGEPSLRDVRGGVIIRGTDDVLRTPEATGLWTDEPRPRIVVSPGGGGHRGTGEFLTAALEALARTGTLGTATVQLILGPYLRESLRVPVGGPPLTVVPYVDAKTDLLRGTDLFIGLGGYNTVQEVAARGVAAVLVSARRAVDDQDGRLRRFFEQTEQVQLSSAAPAELAAAIQRALAARPTAVPAGAGPDGAAQIAGYLSTQYAGTPTGRSEYERGASTFLGRRFVVDERVLVPRRKTELLARTAIGAVTERPGSTVVEIGTGSGAVICSLAAECGDAAEYAATDISADALEVARLNAKALGVDRRIDFRQSDLLDGVDRVPDILVANLPYLSSETSLPPEVRAEPRVAVIDATAGLLPALFRQLRARDRRPATALFEFDPERIPELTAAAHDIFDGENMTTTVHRDEKGLARVVQLTWA